MKQSVMDLSMLFVKESIAYLQANLDRDDASINAANVLFCDKFRLLRNKGTDGIAALIELTAHPRIEVRVMTASVLYLLEPELAGRVLKREADKVETLVPGTLEFLAAERARVTFRLYEAGLKDVAYQFRDSQRRKQAMAQTQVNNHQFA